MLYDDDRDTPISKKIKTDKKRWGPAKKPCEKHNRKACKQCNLLRGKGERK